MKTLRDLFLDELADMYDAESRLVKALPKMAATATHQELQEAISQHHSETEGHLATLRRVFECFGEKAKGKKCEAIVGLLEEADEIADDNKGEPTINAALISAAQKVEHYEIASYGCLREWAAQLEQPEAADLLDEILEEERSADQTLTELARQRCNEAAEKGEEDDDEDAVASSDRARSPRGRATSTAKR